MELPLRYLGKFGPIDQRSYVRLDAMQYGTIKMSHFQSTFLFFGAQESAKMINRDLKLFRLLSFNI